MFTSMIKSEDFGKISSKLMFTDFNNLLFACSHLKLLDKEFEWPILLETFSQKVLANFSI